MPSFSSLGLAVADSCHAFYNTTKTGLGPLAWAWYNASNEAYDPSWDTNTTYRESAKEFGYFIPDGDEQYDSFPETIESIFYAYRITGDTKWQDYNWDIYKSLIKESTGTTPSEPIENVNIPGSFISELPRYVETPFEMSTSSYGVFSGTWWLMCVPFPIVTILLRYSSTSFSHSPTPTWSISMTGSSIPNATRCGAMHQLVRPRDDLMICWSRAWGNFTQLVIGTLKKEGFTNINIF